MLTMATPGAQALSIVSSGAKPPNAAPYPTDVGTAITGAATRPATTPGSAPSIPAATTIARADRSRSSCSSTRCSPATPTSTTSSTGRPRWRAVTAASRATGTSDVPAASTTTSCPVGSGGVPGKATIRASGSRTAPGRASSSVWAWSGRTRVNRVRASRARTCAATTSTCSSVLASQSTASAKPRRRARSWSSRTKSATAGGGVQSSASELATDVQLGQRERSRLDAGEVEGDVPEAGGTDGVGDGLPQWIGGDRRDVLHGDLHPGDLAVVAHPQVGQPQPAQRRFGGVHLRELVWGDLLQVRDPRRQARCGRLVRGRQLEGAGDPPDGGLVEAGVRERGEHAVLAGGPRAGPVGAAGVVGVLAVGDRGEAVRGDDVRRDAGEQLVLAEVAAVRAVGPVGGVVPFGRGHLHHRDADS